MSSSDRVPYRYPLPSSLISHKNRPGGSDARYREMPNRNIPALKYRDTGIPRFFVTSSISVESCSKNRKKIPRTKTLARYRNCMLQHNRICIFKQAGMTIQHVVLHFVICRKLQTKPNKLFPVGKCTGSRDCQTVYRGVKQAHKSVILIPRYFSYTGIPHITSRQHRRRLQIS